MSIEIFVNNSRQLLHLEALGIVFANLRYVSDYIVVIQRSGINDQIANRHRPSLYQRANIAVACTDESLRPVEVAARPGRVGAANSEVTSQRLTRRRLGAYFLAFGLAGLRIGRSLAMVGLLQFVVWLGHRFL